MHLRPVTENAKTNTVFGGKHDVNRYIINNSLSCICSPLTTSASALNSFFCSCRQLWRSRRWMSKKKKKTHLETFSRRLEPLDLCVWGRDVRGAATSVCQRSGVTSGDGIKKKGGKQWENQQRTELHFVCLTEVITRQAAHTLEGNSSTLSFSTKKKKMKWKVINLLCLLFPPLQLLELSLCWLPQIIWTLDSLIRCCEVLRNMSSCLQSFTSNANPGNNDPHLGSSVPGLHN